MELDPTDEEREVPRPTAPPPPPGPEARPDRLRLEDMLRELGAHEGSDPPPPGRAASITVGELVDTTAHAGFGFLVAVLALLVIPFVGVSTPFGLAIALVGVQLVTGRHRPWLPQRLRRRPLSMAMLDRVLGMIARRMRWLARSTQPRWLALVQPRLVGVAIVLLGLGLALPLPMPGSNLVFVVPLLAYAVGLLERDGLWIALAHVGTLADLALVAVFGATIVTLLSHAWHVVF